MDLILGSQSPRRKEILSYFSLPFRQIPSDFDESLVAFQGDPIGYALELSQKKGAALASLYPKSTIVTADTVVYFDGRLFNKPKSEEEAIDMLSQLSGRWHHVFTGVCIHHDGTFHSKAEETKILFKSLNEEQIRTYQKACSSLDKAGGYAIQNSGNIIVKHIDGCYYNVMGLPINVLDELLLKIGINLWKFLKPC